MSSSTEAPKRILIIQYSFSAQTRSLVRSMLEGLNEYPVSVYRERLEPVIEQHFPIGTIPKTVHKMIVTLFRQRVPIKPLSPQCFEKYDLIILAGPTWSYNPSGPVLSLLVRFSIVIWHRLGLASFLGRSSLIVQSVQRLETPA